MIGVIKLVLAGGMVELPATSTTSTGCRWGQRHTADVFRSTSADTPTSLETRRRDRRRLDNDDDVRTAGRDNRPAGKAAGRRRSRRRPFSTGPCASTSSGLDGHRDIAAARRQLRCGIPRVVREVPGFDGPGGKKIDSMKAKVRRGPTSTPAGGTETRLTRAAVDRVGWRTYPDRGTGSFMSSAVPACNATTAGSPLTLRP